MSLRFLLFFFGLAHSFALLSKDLQSFVNTKLMPSDLVKMKAADPNWRGEGIFEKITEVAGLFVHKETNKIILETKEKLWTESEIINEFKYMWGGPDAVKNFIRQREWNELFYRYLDTDQFRKYWREALAEIVDLNKKYKNYEPVLMVSIKSEKSGRQRVDCSAIKILLERGADVKFEETKEFYSKGGQTSLHWASADNNIEAIELLLKFKAEINATDGLGETPMMKAVKGWSADAVKVLLDRGACSVMRNSEKMTALDIAKSFRKQYYSERQRIENEKIIELLETQQK